MEGINEVQKHLVQMGEAVARSADFRFPEALRIFAGSK